MEQNNERVPDSEERRSELKLQTENIAYSSDQMVKCEKCGKPNPPNRSSCLYCASDLDIVAGGSDIRLNLRKLEGWENGFNIVFVPPAIRPDKAAIANQLKLTEDTFSRMLSAPCPLPLARLGSEEDAKIAVERLASAGVNASIVRDVDLKVGKPNTRLRCIRFQDAGIELTLFNTGQAVMVPSQHIELIVVGRIVETNTESVEKGRGEKKKVLAETSTANDDILIDIYIEGRDTGWRTMVNGFDFSGLGAEKRMLASENIQRLLDQLKKAASNAKVVDQYSALIGVLSEVWDIERRTDFGGLKRTGVWKSGFASVARTSNLEQFTKFSRLQRVLI